MSIIKEIKVKIKRFLFAYEIQFSSVYLDRMAEMSRVHNLESVFTYRAVVTPKGILTKQFEAFGKPLFLCESYVPGKDMRIRLILAFSEFETFRKVLNELITTDDEGLSFLSAVYSRALRESLMFFANNYINNFDV